MIVINRHMINNNNFIFDCITFKFELKSLAMYDLLTKQSQPTKRRKEHNK